MKKLLAALLVAGLALPLSSLPAHADPDRHGHRGDGPRPPAYNGEWRDRGRGHDRHNVDARRLNERERWNHEHWREGRAWHGRYNGRTGWWWVLNSVYYPYAGPALRPYPAPVAYAAPPVYAPGRAVSYYYPNPAGYYP